jgi:putative phosphoribosyl transferase
VFRDRVDAGQQLAELLDGFRSPATVVLGIPRGGVVVAAEVARHLHAPLDVVVTRKLGSPYHPEYAVGAIGEGGVRIVDDAAVRASHIAADALRDVEKAERAELARRTALFRGGRTRRDLTGSLAVVVDDGIATGATATVSCRAVRQLGAATVVLATPVAPRDWADRLRGEADHYVAASTPSPFWAVGQWYHRFDQTADDEVIAALTAATSRATSER